MKALDDLNIWTHSQSVHARQHFDDEGRKVRVTIKRNSHDEQTNAIAEVFDPVSMRWNEIASLPVPQMASIATVDNGRGQQIPLVSYVSKFVSNGARAAIQDDISALLRQVEMILS